MNSGQMMQNYNKSWLDEHKIEQQRDQAATVLFASTSPSEGPASTRYRLA
jgi:hypothetical protein